MVPLGRIEKYQNQSLNIDKSNFGDFQGSKSQPICFYITFCLNSGPGGTYFGVSWGLKLMKIESHHIYFYDFREVI